ncbi:ABC transporter substrate-binding protein [Roseovarius spongiae]|uniref:ABC transporter substrate-binding protein n=1 Tax=Roseovarius spongiae TaxID=2320272 RepID=A0A3A8AVF6_9RHOB|nr:ABC transporter substrate-binding protein [Roseovarius spongiae]RKF14183.1 ABC transporter substrate-binding protein [Roseovarius spongiae]
MTHRIFTLAMLGAVALAAPATAQDEPRVAPPDSLVEAGTLTYGTAASFPPFEYQDPDSGGITGFDIEMIQTLAGYMGLETDVLDIDFDGLVPALRGERIDVINSAMYIKPEREEQVDFVRYMVIGEAIVVPSGKGDAISTLPDDLSGLDVAVTRGAIGERYMVDFNEQLEAKGMDPMNIMAFPTNQDALLAVRSGRADAFDTSIPGAAHLNEQRPGEFEVAATFDLGTEIGIATRKGDAEMQRATGEALEIFVEEGGYEQLLDKYGLPAAVNYFAQD